jgi:DNA invertase Pin-like site-specific DNA recombinase
MTVDENNKTEPAIKIAAIWARVSTAGQKETSILTQVEACRAKLIEQGYIVRHIFEETFCSLDLYASEKFLELRRLITRGSIDAVCFYDSDRIEAEGSQRINFLIECRDFNVEAISVYGAPIDVNSPEGKLMIMVQAISKEKQVLRARTGARDGLRDRVKLRKLPASYRPIEGYDWILPNPKATPPIIYPRLTENKVEFPKTKLIADLMKEGETQTTIIKELKSKGMKSPNGAEEWSGTEISRIVHNPVYAGRYYGLKTTATREPRKVGAKSKKIPFEKQYYIPEIVVESPLFTWEERQQILARFALHARNSNRNAKRDYLLRNRIFSGELTDKKGQPQKYHGRLKHGQIQYRCPKPVFHRILNGTDIEPYVKGQVLRMVTNLKRQSKKTNPTTAVNVVEALDKELKKIELDKSTIKNRLVKAWEQKTDAEHNGKSFDNDIYEIIKGKNTHELDNLVAREETIKEQKLQLANKQMVATEMVTFFSKFGVTDAKSNPTDREWRELFEIIDLRVRVNTIEQRDGMIRVFDYGAEQTTFWGDVDVNIEVGVPMPYNFLGEERVTPSLTLEMEERLDSISVGSIASRNPRS